MIKLSIIVPVYNVDKYLEECIQSIINQSPEGYEIILVDDGSTDKSGEICDLYSQKYKDTIKVIHKENGGLSSARTEGMNYSKGLYIAFIDSDDRIAEGSLSCILKWIEDTDVDLCFMNAIKFYEDGTKQSLGDCIYREFVYGNNKEMVIKYLSSRPKYPGSACTKLYKRAFLYEKEIFFPKDRRTSEDLGFVLDCIMNADSYDALECPYYEYRQNRKGSITNSVSSKCFWDHATFISESIQKIYSSDYENLDLYKPLMAFVAYEYSIMLYMYNQISANEKVRAYEFLKNNKSVLKYSKTKKVMAVRLVLYFCGIKNTAKLLNVYMKNRL